MLFQPIRLRRVGKTSRVFATADSRRYDNQASNGAHPPRSGAAHFESALRVMPAAEAHNGLGFVLSKQGKVDDAILRFREAIRANPKYTAAIWRAT